MADLAFSFIQDYGSLLLFLIIFLGIIGFPIPDEGVLVFAGYLIAERKLMLVPAFVLAGAAASLGTCLNYFIGRKLGSRKLIRLTRRLGFPMRRWKKTVRFLQTYGRFGSFLAVFVPGLRIGAAYTAGVIRLPLVSFVVSSTSGIMAWTALYMALGYFTGTRLL